MDAAIEMWTEVRRPGVDRRTVETGGHERQATKAFQRLQSHCPFETSFCPMRRANEKGHVECCVDFGRANFLVPVPSVASLAEIHKTPEDRRRGDLSRWRRGKDGTKAVRSEEEQVPSCRCQPRSARRGGSRMPELVHCLRCASIPTATACR